MALTVPTPYCGWRTFMPTCNASTFMRASWVGPAKKSRAERIQFERRNRTGARSLQIKPARHRRGSSERRNRVLINCECLIEIGHGDVQVAQESVLQAIDPAMHREFLTTFPGVAGNRGLADVDHLFDDVQLAQPVRSGGIT